MSNLWGFKDLKKSVKKCNAKECNNNQPDQQCFKWTSLKPPGLEKIMASNENLCP